ncbi:unnamed protein product [Bemisia tabaci]|uniref:RNA exonuclease 4 n=1 Tax=Bemisia tabaci TaxID=7038 RepID=A0A9P0A7L9_BEMTA|nr:unnamed protein product [Bemisia tabaci]
MLNTDQPCAVEKVASVVRNSTSNNWLQFLKGTKKPTKQSKKSKFSFKQKQLSALSAVASKVKEDSSPYIAPDFPRYKSKPEVEPSPIPMDDEEEPQIDTQTVNFPLKPFRNNYVALDCEMVGVDKDKKGNMLGRVSIVNWNGECIYDKYVKPMEKVTDYRTSVSGLKATDLQNGEDFTVVQKEVASILKGKILVGHALTNDFKVLFLSHPRRKIRDTSTFHKFRQACGKRPSLKKLVAKFLRRNIQDGEHCSIEDAKATMQLFQLFCEEWESSINGKKTRSKR